MEPQHVGSARLSSRRSSTSAPPGAIRERRRGGLAEERDATRTAHGGHLAHYRDAHADGSGLLLQLLEVVPRKHLVLNDSGFENPVDEQRVGPLTVLGIACPMET